MQTYDSLSETEIHHFYIFVNADGKKVALKEVLEFQLWISCHYTHLPKGFDLEEISKP
jgi:hypothetical protein